MRQAAGGQSKYEKPSLGSSISSARKSNVNDDDRARPLLPGRLPGFVGRREILGKLSRRHISSLILGQITSGSRTDKRLGARNDIQRAAWRSAKSIRQASEFQAGAC